MARQAQSESTHLFKVLFGARDLWPGTDVFLHCAFVPYPGLAMVMAFLFHQPVAWLLHGGFFANDIPNGYGHNLTVYLSDVDYSSRNSVFPVPRVGGA